MLVHLIPLVCLLQSGSVEPPTQSVVSLIGKPSVAVWFAPVAMRRTVLPLGLQVGVQLGRLLVAGAYASLPVPNIRATQWSLGGRWYLGLGGVAPYFAFEGASRTEEIDDTGGRTASYELCTGGIGVELSKRGLSLSSDLQLGSESRKSEVRGSAWLLAVQYRLGLGFHF